MPNSRNSEVTDAAPAPGAHTQAPVALFYGLGAYTLWGVFPLYFRAVAHISPWLVVCHRIVWSVVFLGAVISLRREWLQIKACVLNRRSVLLLAMGAVLIAANWLIFIYAVGSGQTLEASMGYFINPLLSIALGMIFLRERLRPLQWLAVAVAAIAVVHLWRSGAGLPWIALSLAATFGFYGLVRKKVNVNSLHGLMVETVILLPVALLTLLFLPESKGGRPYDLALLSLSGVITAVPLLLFGAAVRGLKLSTIGFLQYVGPTLQFLLAILVLGEHLNAARLTGFIICWVAIAIYVLDSLLSRVPQPVADEPD